MFHRYVLLLELHEVMSFRRRNPCREPEQVQGFRQLQLRKGANLKACYAEQYSRRESLPEKLQPIPLSEFASREHKYKIRTARGIYRREPFTKHSAGDKLFHMSLPSKNF
jgi:hypothetical protein